jgi:Flp pilus assembly pilin Flp
MAIQARRTEGQGMVEYILIVGLIALLAYAAVNTLGTNVSEGFNKAATKVSDGTTW